MMSLTTWKKLIKVIGGLVVGFVMLFVGLSLIDAGSNVCIFTGINPSIIAGQIFTMLGLVIIVVALATPNKIIRKRKLTKEEK